jgi:hypothetical protein
MGDTPVRGVPVEVVTDGVTVMIDVPWGVPIVCGVGGVGIA